MSREPEQILKQYWGYDRFRSPQKDIISSVLAGNDTMALLPTGGGKSLCYQLPALMLPGKTVVVSPLISLMQDQVNSLQKRGINAKAIYAGMRYSEIEAILDNFVHGPLKLLYISPERIMTEAFQVRYYMANVSLLAIDEAHCISQWGHDFRPSYLNISLLREIKPKVPVMSLTATATKNILADIAKQLGLNAPAIFRKSFARENISFSSIRTEDKAKELVHIIRKLNGTGIIYSRSRLGCVKIANWLNTKGLKAIHYHAGLSSHEREKAQSLWMNNKVRIIVATNAFGMGIDKPDVRFVIHLDIPPSIEEYYQEAGRAGRDGNQSYAISLISNQDILSAIKNFEAYHPTLEEIKNIYIHLCRKMKIAFGEGDGRVYYIDLLTFAKECKLNVAKLFTTLKVLEKQGWLEMSDGLKNPSKALVTANPRTINDIYPPDDPRYLVLTQLLRSYEGIFQDFIDIYEEKIAKVLNMEKAKVIAYLKVLQNEAMINYEPSSEDPKITLLKARPHDDSFRIDENSYNTLKDNTWKKLQMVVAFHTTESCRQQFILDYFDETDAINCGQCDICFGSHSATYSKDDYQEVLQIISSNNGIEAKDILYKFSYVKRQRVYQCLNDLESEQKIKTDARGLIVINK